MTPNDLGRYQIGWSEFTQSEKMAEPKINGRVRELTDVEKAWLAGVVDGEGSIIISKIAPNKGHYRRGFYYRANLEIANSASAFIKRVLELIGKGSAAFTKEKHVDWKDKWQYQASCRVL